MESRIRNHSIIGPGGDIRYRWGDIASALSVTFQEDLCSDFYKKERRDDGSLPPSACRIVKHTRNPASFSSVFNTTLQAHGYACLGGDLSEDGMNRVRPHKASLGRIAQNNDLALELLAATNPFRAEYSVPVALKELVDLGALFKIAASSFASYVGSNYLNYKFGWVQFLNDIRKLHGITTAIERRIREIQSLSKKGGIRRNVSLSGNQTWSEFTEREVIHSTYGFTIHADVQRDYHCITRGSVRWRWRDGIDVELTELQAFNLAVSNVFDLDEIDSQTAWNLIPFSWLANYFVKLDELFGAYEGIGIIEPYDLCIIRQTKGKSSAIPTPSMFFTFTSGSFSVSEYDRDYVTAVSGFPAINVSILSKNQMLIIAALLASFKR